MQTSERGKGYLSLNEATSTACLTLKLQYSSRVWDLYLSECENVAALWVKCLLSVLIRSHLCVLHFSTTYHPGSNWDKLGGMRYDGFNFIKDRLPVL